ncbi:MAG: hypothetical protein ACI4UU_00495 [Clostridia bacterium]
MEKIIAIGGTITAIITIVASISKVLDVKLSGLYNNQRLQYRYEICSFAGDLRNGIIKTREEFQAIFEMYDQYETLIEKLKQKNHYIDNEMAYISEQYKILK